MYIYYYIYIYIINICICNSIYIYIYIHLYVLMYTYGPRKDAQFFSMWLWSYSLHPSRFSKLGVAAVLGHTHFPVHAYTFPWNLIYIPINKPSEPIMNPLKSHIHIPFNHHHGFHGYITPFLATGSRHTMPWPCGILLGILTTSFCKWSMFASWGCESCTWGCPNLVLSYNDEYVIVLCI